MPRFDRSDLYLAGSGAMFAIFLSTVTTLSNWELFVATVSAGACFLLLVMALRR